MGPALDAPQALTYVLCSEYKLKSNTGRGKNLFAGAHSPGQSPRDSPRGDSPRGDSPRGGLKRMHRRRTVWRLPAVCQA